MSLKATITDNTKEQLDNIYEKIINAFIYAGENFVKAAREQMQDHAMGTYKDVTTNLRNSIGYYVYYDGELIKDNTNISSNDMIVKDLIKQKGFQLIGLAGMNYASHVESKGYNVISYQGDLCMIELEGYLENIGIIAEGTAARTEESFLPDDLPANFRVE